MGKGDRKSKKGKISMGSFGVSRPKKKSTPAAVTTSRAQQAPKEEAKPAKPKASAKAPAKKKSKDEKEK